MKALKANKFRVGDKVKVVSHKNTVKRFGRDSDDLAKIGTEGIINNVTDWCVGIEEDMFLLDVDDVILLDKTESATKETNTSQDESIDKFFESDVILPKDDEDDFTCCLGKGIESKPYNPLVAQEGGGHYKNRGIQPIEYSHANNLSASQHSVVKYITRYYDKGGIEDLSKIVHFVLLEAYFRYGEQGSTELKDKILTILGENKES